MKNISTIVAAYCTAAAQGAKSVEQLKSAMQNVARDEGAPAIMEAVATWHRVKLVAKTRGEGFTWADSKCVAAQRSNYLIRCVYGTKQATSGHTEEPSRAMLKAAKALLDVCGSKAAARAALNALA